MVEFFTFTEASRGPPEASWRSGLWTAVHRLSTPDLKNDRNKHTYLETSGISSNVTQEKTLPHWRPVRHGNHVKVDAWRNSVKLFN